MGLDITVYKNVKPLIKDGEHVHGDYDRDLLEEEFSDLYMFTAFVITPEWNDRIKNFNIDYYYYGEPVYEFGYGYSYHSNFRNKLGLLVGLADGEWLDITNDKPFFEICQFADNEGVMDFECAAELYKDFLEYKEKAYELYADDEWLLRRYEDWLEATRLAKEDGAIDFH